MSRGPHYRPMPRRRPPWRVRAARWLVGWDKPRSTYPHHVGPHERWWRR